MHTFYESATILVTDRFVEIKGRQRRSVSVPSIKQVYLIRAAESGRRSSRWTAGFSVLTAAAVAAHSVASGPAPPVLLPAAALFIAGTTIMVERCCPRTTYELWGIVDDRHLCIFRSADLEVFGQVRRAVGRARENADRHLE